MELLDWLKLRKTTLQKFAIRLGVPYSSMHRYAHGQRRIPADLALKIRRRTGGAVTPESFVGQYERNAREDASA